MGYSNTVLKDLCLLIGLELEVICMRKDRKFGILEQVKVTEKPE